MAPDPPLLLRVQQSEEVHSHLHVPDVQPLQVDLRERPVLPQAREVGLLQHRHQEVLSHVPLQVEAGEVGFAEVRRVEPHSCGLQRAAANAADMLLLGRDGLSEVLVQTHGAAAGADAGVVELLDRARQTERPGGRKLPHKTGHLRLLASSDSL